MNTTVMTYSRPSIKIQLLGCLAILASAFLFYFAAVSIRLANEKINVPALFFVAARFCLGALIYLWLALCRRSLPKVCEYRYLSLRIVFNFAAVALFFIAVRETTVAEANILNMTYPAYIALFSFFFFQHKGEYLMLLLGVAAFLGSLLVMGVFDLDMEFRLASLWGVGSGLFASLAIVSLNVTRQFNSTDAILFYLFLVGAIFSLLLCLPILAILQTAMLPYLLFCALFGVLGQFFLTYGFRHVTALEGSIVSSSRIVIAALLSPLITADPWLTKSACLGAGVILLSNVYIAFRK